MTKNRRIVLIILIVVTVAVFVSLFLFTTAQKKSPTETTHIVILDNQSQYSRGINSDVFDAIAKMNYKMIALNINKPADIYHGTIRSNSFKSIVDNTVSFIIDIPSIKTSWLATQAIDTEGETFSDALVQCIPKDKAIYPFNADCKDLSNADTGSVDNSGFDMAKDLPLTGQNYSINYSYSDTVGNNGYVVILTYYTPEGKQEGLDALTSLGYDITKYTFNYIDGS